ncbi:MAG: aminopeptidase N [Pseudomonadota bacterium]
MRDTAPMPIYLKDYQKHAFEITDIALEFELHPTETQVTAVSKVSRNRKGEDFTLDGHSMILKAVYVDDQQLSESNYILTDQDLTLPSARLPEGDFTLKIVTQIDPSNNTSLEGLYRSGTMYCTQCESQGFRKITYFIDRPDNMARYRVKLIGEDDKMPVLLSNGHKIEEGQDKNGRPYAVWEDPHKKPSYLFALVAGDLAVHKDKFTTQSGRDVALEIYVEHGNEDRCDYAMDSLKRSMRWDEEKYGREYDLDIFMIVAVSDFNFGAMENKGLNIFNAKYILAKSETATDTDYENIEAIIAHEYFHNWTGNRITCRDWFQLCLKEGLTVFRDQSFTGDMRSSITKRIDDVIMLRNAQFPEDAGPLAHPVRPESYIEINNFYTATVYEKGAELCRMLAVMLGQEGFRKGTDLFFERFDGMAVTVEDFVQSMADASGKDLSQFLLWYKQAGTPHVTAHGVYHADQGRYHLTLSQKTHPTQGQDSKVAMHIPVLVALISPSGEPITSEYAGKSAHEHMIELKEDKAEFIFENVSEAPLVSLFRDFSAPIILHQDISTEECFLLMQHETNPFNAYEIAQNIAEGIILSLYDEQTRSDIENDVTAYCAAIYKILQNETYDPLYKSYMIGLPSLGYLMQKVKNVQPQKLYDARTALRDAIAAYDPDALIEAYQKTRSDKAFDPAPSEATRRALGNKLLSYIVLADAKFSARAEAHYRESDNMTDMMGALSALSDRGGEIYNKLMQEFFVTYEKDQLVIDKWFALQARSQASDVLDQVKSLLNHKDFTYKNPNRVRSLIGVFAHGNLVHFHKPDAYAFIAEQILILDKLNPKTAARMATAFDQIHLLDPALSHAARGVLEHLLEKKSEISNDLYEIIFKTLGGSAKIAA